MAVPMSELLADLRREGDELTAVIRGIPPQAWELPTPAEGWAVRDQISHLAWFDDAATAAATDPEGFRATVPGVLGRENAVDEIAATARALSAAQVLEWFLAARARSLEVFERLDPRARLPWYGFDMSAASFVTARLMETWAHGQDVADALGVSRVPTARLRHVALLGARALPYGFTVRGEEPPADPVRVELALPDGTPWAYGPEDAADLVRGPALDFCLLVTQRCALADTALEVRGETARRWMSRAQAFAGPPGGGRPAGLAKALG
ncbi:TIGR03084 family metal-binding protein [Sphaerisporangium sp. TRM90804]|uniref:TIGR03084 family metal-binding protein n=1 Tax=Sphaerisporangium sp. TRM90804 TaxID=3031113 RepID=UPI00244B6F57|nr:TIGR03084 family metal-binding protein [Sphaerisporangium sp. TRM90804]MDH2424213.1 TIGR03084 family metal-binding protein [Sphaerisporangium sp. TRM90804]